MSNLHPSPKILKQDMFGSVELIHFNGSGTNSQLAICRDINCARWWVRYLARYLARRELKALNKLQQAQVAEQQVPMVLHAAQGRVVRSYIPGNPI
jgi:RIO-like serine/threonine protein kinase